MYLKRLETCCARSRDVLAAGAGEARLEQCDGRRIWEDLKLATQSDAAKQILKRSEQDRKEKRWEGAGGRVRDEVVDRQD